MACWKAERATLLAAVLVALPAAAEDGLARCRTVADDAERLRCYDALAAPATPAPEREFGLKRKPAAEAATKEPDRIEARLVGKFSGWERDTRFALDNGQVWQSDGAASGYYTGVPDNPAVTIERSWFGSYWMSVAGGPQAIRFKVRRVR